MISIRWAILLALAAATQSCSRKQDVDGGHGWQVVSNPFTGEQIRSVQFVSRDTVVALALNLGTELSDRYNAILTSADKGVTWTEQRLPVPEAGGVGELFALHSNLLFAGKNGIFRCDNAQSWTGLDPVIGNMQNRMLGIYFFDHNEGIVLTTAALFKTYNAGAAFSFALTDSSGGVFVDLEAVGNQAFALSSTGALFWSLDRGAHWQYRSQKVFEDIHFVNEQTAFGLWDDAVFRTTDGGQTWQRMNPAPVTVPYGGKLFFVSESVGFILSRGGTILATYDRGRTWETEYSGTKQLNGASCNGENRIIVVGQGNLILSRQI